MTRSKSFLLAACLVMLGPTAGQAEPIHESLPLSAWIGFLKHPEANQRLRLQAVKALAVLGEQHFAARPPLIAALGDAAEPIRTAAEEGLARYGTAVVADLLTALKDDNPARRTGAAQLLARLPGDEAVPALRRALADPLPAVRQAAARRLVRQPELAKPVAITLLGLLDQEDAERRAEVLRLLGSCGPAAAPAVPKLRRLLASKEVQEGRIQRRSLAALAADVLGLIGPVAREAIPDLKEILLRKAAAGVPAQQMEALDLRVSAACALIGLGAEREVAYGVLGEALDFRAQRIDPQWSRYYAADFLSEDRQRRILTVLLQDRPLPAGDEKADPLPPRHFPFNPRALAPLQMALAHKKEAVRAGALRALYHFRDLPEPLLAEVRRLADVDVDTQVRRWAVVVLASRGAVLGNDDLDELVAGLAYEGGSRYSHRHQRWVFDWRGPIWPLLTADAAAVPVLVRALGSEQPHQRAGAAEALAVLALAQNPEVRKALLAAVPALKELAEKDRLWEGRRWTPPPRGGMWAAVALARLERETPAVVPALLAYRIFYQDYRNSGRRHIMMDGEPPLDDATLDRLDGVARDAIGQLGEQALPALRATLKETGPERNAALGALAELASSGLAAGAWPILASALTDPNPDLRSGAAAALGRLSRTAAGPALPMLRRLLGDKTPGVRLQAALALARLGDTTEWTLETLLAGLQSQDEVLQLPALYALQNLELPPTRALELLCLALEQNKLDLLFLFYRATADPVAPLLALLDHPEESTRRLAIDALGQLGPMTLADLRRALAHPSSLVRCGAASALRGLDSAAGPAIPDLRRALRDPDPAVALQAAVTLGAVKADLADGLPILLRNLEQGDAAARQLAIAGLNHLGERAPAAVPQLNKALMDSDADVRAAAAAALRNWPKGGRDCLPNLLDLVRGETEGHVLRSALQTIARLTRDHPEDQKRAARVCLDLLDIANEECRDAATTFLNRQLNEHIAPVLLAKVAPRLRELDSSLSHLAKQTLSSAGPAAIPHLVDLLRDPRPEVRVEVVNLLRDLNAPKKQTIPIVVSSLKDGDASVREAAYAILGRCRGEEGQVVPVLIERLLCEKATDRALAADALANLGQPARAAVPALFSQLSHADAAVRSSALDALVQLKPDAAAALPHYAALLRDESPALRARAAGPLAGLGPAAALPLGEALRDPDENVRFAAAEALASLKATSQELLPGLRMALRDDSARVRAATTLAVANLGTAAAPAASALAALLRDGDPEVKAGAATALGALGKLAQERKADLKVLLRDRREEVRKAAAEALIKIGTGG